MKNLKKLLFLSLLITSSLTFAQNAENPFKFTFGFSAIDAFPTNDQNEYETGTLFEDYFNVSEHWNINNVPNFFSGSFYFEDGFTLSMRGSLNKINKLGKTEVDETAMTLDFAVQYGIIKNYNFDLYASAGAGKYWMGTHSSGTVNLGLGVDYWFTDSMAFTFESTFKHTASRNGIPHIQHAFGLSIR